jgi:hypothetical protein
LPGRLQEIASPLRTFCGKKPVGRAKLSVVSTDNDTTIQVEGQWEELVQHADQFAGKRVRVIVLPERHSALSSLRQEIVSWLAAGDAIEISRLAPGKSDAFSDGLADKFRKQGLVP